MAQVDPQRGRALRRRADRAACPGSRRCSTSAAAGNGVVPGEAAFRLYDTYGLPRDFIEDMIETASSRLDQDGFERAMEGQREKARAKSAFKGSGCEGRDVDGQRRSSRGARVNRRQGLPRLRLDDDQHADPCALRRRTAGSAVAHRGTGRFRRSDRDAVLSRGRRTGLGRRHHRGPSRRGTRHRRRARRRTGRACTRVHVTSGELIARATW